MNTYTTHDFGTHQILQIPIYQDNYVYAITDGSSAVVVDPGLAKPVQDILTQHHLKLTHILNTHHHWDHVTGNLALKDQWDCEVYGSDFDRLRIPGITRNLCEHDTLNVLGLHGRVLFIPGHTLGHIAYYFPDQKWLFSGDTLFSLGCGRLFEGSPQQMKNSLAKLKSLPSDTLVFCTHEYTETNLFFHRSVFAHDTAIAEREIEVRELRVQGKPTVPTTLGLEISTNLFLRWDDEMLRHHFGLADKAAWEVFAHIRGLRDSF